MTERLANENEVKCQYKNGKSKKLYLQAKAERENAFVPPFDYEKK